MNRYLIAPVVAAIAIAAPAAAQDATATATKLVDLLTPPNQTSAGVEAQIKEIRAGAAIRAMLSQNPGIRAELAKNTPAMNAGLARIGAMQADSMGPIMREAQAASRKEAIDSYAKSFTAAELQQILAFYTSPVGAKLRQQQPLISRQMAVDSQKRFAPRLEAANKAMAPKIEAELKKMFPQAGAAK